MAKIFGIGLSKTGTTSLAEALRILGYSVVDFPQNNDEIDRHEAATDTPVACRFEQLDRAYPGSKFIYTTRDIDSWLRSCERYWALLDEQIAAQPFQVELFTRLYGSAQFDRELFASAYAGHERRIREYFAERPDDLLIFDMGRGAGWETLCGFLARPVPSLQFHRRNTFRAAVWQTRRRALKQRVWRSLKPLVPKAARPLVRSWVNPPAK